MPHFAHGGNARGVDETGPKVLADVLDGVYSDSIDSKGRNKVADPRLQRENDIRVLGVDIGHVVVEPACRVRSMSASFPGVSFRVLGGLTLLGLDLVVPVRWKAVLVIVLRQDKRPVEIARLKVPTASGGAYMICHLWG